MDLISGAVRAGGPLVGLNPPTADTLTWNWPDTPALIAGTIVIALVARFVIHRTIDKVVSSAIARTRPRDRDRTGAARAGLALAQVAGFGGERQSQRTATLGSLLRSITTFVIATIAILMVMSLVGLPLAPLLASAGVGGVALGIGAQSLVKDFLAGICMIVEDQFGVGDVIDTGEVTGTVEEVSLRVTRLRDANGVVWYVRNGEVVRIANSSQGWGTAIVDLPVAYDEEAAKVVDILQAAVTSFAAEERWSQMLLDPPHVAGVEAISGGSMVLRVIAKCTPSEKLTVQRELRERCKDALDAAGVRGPRPIYGPPPSPPNTAAGSTVPPAPTD